MGILLFELFRNPLFMGILNKWETLVKKYMRSNDITDMREDWMAIGGDLKRAMREYSKR